MYFVGERKICLSNKNWKELNDFLNYIFEINKRSHFPGLAVA